MKSVPAKIFTGSILFLIFCQPLMAGKAKLFSHQIRLEDGRKFTLKLHPNYEILPAAQRLQRPRFLAQAPDGRYFVTDMIDMSDNVKGIVYALGRLDRSSGRFEKPRPFLKNLRNPNSVAFLTDKLNRHWFYVAETHRLVRYRYSFNAGKPDGKPEVLVRFPDYGLDYRYGGWHLTRTIAVGGNGKVYVSVGSSCNSCKEKADERDIRAVVLEMNPDGSERRVFARNARNAVGLKWIGGGLYATLQGVDHLGLNSPDDTFHAIKEGGDYGWPECVQNKGRIIFDKTHEVEGVPVRDCAKVPSSMIHFPAHSSAMGFDYFGTPAAEPLRNSFLIALHGSTSRSDRRGYKIVVAQRGAKHDTFVDGFRKKNRVVGRPCDIMKVSDSSFLFTDDNAGVIYYVRKKPGQR